MLREIENIAEEQSSPDESSSAWQRISRELLDQHPGIKVAQNRSASGGATADRGDAGLPKLRPLGDTIPISETDPFPSLYEELNPWPNLRKI